MKTKLQLSDDGTIRIPLSVLKEFGLKPGDSITVQSCTDGSFDLFSGEGSGSRGANAEYERSLREWIFNDDCE